MNTTQHYYYAVCSSSQPKRKMDTPATTLRKPNNFTAYIRAIYIRPSRFAGNHSLLQGITMIYHDYTLVN
jgi:hypothetical protein